MRRLAASTKRAIERIFAGLDYSKLATVYCDEGGMAFWEERRERCRHLGIELAEVLLNRLTPAGKSLYVGAGVAELPLLTMETLELNRTVNAFNLRREEVSVINAACADLPFRLVAGDAASAPGRFDHLCLISVLNDPERFPELSALSYGRANPVQFDTERFSKEREAVLALTDACLHKLIPPALITTSVEEIPWITDWCEQHELAWMVEEEDYPTAVVEDPVCLIRIARGATRKLG